MDSRESRLTMVLLLHSHPAVGKARCDLCMMYFTKDSMSQCVAMKSLVNLRKECKYLMSVLSLPGRCSQKALFTSRTGGIINEARRYNVASYLYSKARLCAFCTQFFQERAPAKVRQIVAGKHEDSVNGVAEAIKRAHATNTQNADADAKDLRESNLAFDKPAYMSSVADGHGPSQAVNGNVETDRDHCCRSRREHESWWEVDLEDTYPIKAITIVGRTGSSSYRMEPYYIFVADKPIRSKTLSDARRDAIATRKVSPSLFQCRARGSRVLCAETGIEKQRPGPMGTAPKHTRVHHSGAV